MSGALFSFKTAIGLAAGVTGLGLLVSRSLAATDRIGKLSQTYGIATKQLAAFNLAATRSSPPSIAGLSGGRECGTPTARSCHSSANIYSAYQSTYYQD